MAMKQEVNEPCEGFLDAWQMKLKSILHSKIRIEIHIYTNEWVSLTNELLELNSHNFSFEGLPGLATKLLVMLTGHVKALAMDWFPGMLLSPSAAASSSEAFITYVPCWKCYAEIGTPRSLSGGKCLWYWLQCGNKFDPQIGKEVGKVAARGMEPSLDNPIGRVWPQPLPLT
jgi:hypothetical protein